MMNFRISLEKFDYSVEIYNDFKTISNAVQGVWLEGEKIFIITDDNVKNLYLDEIVEELNKITKKIYVFIVPNGEESKNINVVNEIYNDLLKKEFDKKDLIISLGGGVVGDISGFVAATFLRGVQYIQVPTTLLSQIDSSVGGKVAINFNGVKNIIGTFYHPALVYINTKTLKTLSDAEYKCGLSESIVHSLVGDIDLLHFIQENICENQRISEKKIDKFVFNNCKFKANIVVQDEKDHYIRKNLNLGHTFGHAFESYFNYKYKHGECVSVGIVMAFKIATIKKIISKELLSYIVNILEHLGLPVKFENVDWLKIIERIFLDKKKNSNYITMILPINIGNVIQYSMTLEELEKIVFENFTKKGLLN